MSTIPKGTKVNIMKGEYAGKKGVTFQEPPTSEGGKYSVQVLDTGVTTPTTIMIDRSEISTDAELQEKFKEVQKRATGKTGGRKSRKSRGKKRVTRKKRSTRRR